LYEAGSESTAHEAMYTLAPSGHGKTRHPKNTAIAGGRQWRNTEPPGLALQLTVPSGEVS